MSINKNYTGFSVDDLLHDRDFVLEVNKQNKASWNTLLDKHPQERESMIQAKKIIEVFEVTESPLDTTKKARLWGELKQFSDANKTPRIIPWYRIVAAAVIALLILAGGWYWNNYRQTNWYFESNNTTGKPEVQKSTLVLPNGNKVALNEAKSTLTVLENKQAILINRDSIVPVEKPILKTTQKEELNKVIVPYGEESNLLLADGTKVWLNAGSSFAFPMQFSGKTRKVFLEGEAYFEVSKNTEKPFIVSTHNINVKVYGTKFNVSAYRNDGYTEAVLLEGKISLTENRSLFGKETYMAPGQKALYNEENNNIVLEKTEKPELYTSWREGWYEFSNVDLTYVTHKLERYYNVEFEYNSEVIQSSYKLSGKLELKESLDKVLSILAKVTNTNYQIDGNKIKVSASKQEKK
ncbi:MAG: FecR family protein [Draconibacterium sp.]